MTDAIGAHTRNNPGRLEASLRGPRARRLVLLLAIPLLGTACAPWRAGDTAPGDLGWPAGVREVRIESSFDGTRQPALFYAPAAQAVPAPLLVALHSWHADYRSTRLAPAAEAAIARGWVFLHPDFRGPNERPEALGSELAQQDVLDAVAWAKGQARVDPARILLLGFSGGGLVALLVAARAPDLWAGVSVWGPVTDIATWYAEAGDRDRGAIERALGGDPTTDPVARAEAARRSPLESLAGARSLPVELHAGIADERVSVGHALRAFDAMATQGNRLGDQNIRSIAGGAVPTALRAPPDARLGDRRVLVRRRSGMSGVTVFEGGHEILFGPAIDGLTVHAK